MILRYEIPSNALPECLRTLPNNIKSQISDTLSNDEVSGDDEIVEFWIKQCGVPEEAAREAIKFRDEHFRHPVCILFPELYE